jgi:hypothetical protein
MRVLNSVWVGETLGPLEQLCIRSGLAAGHSFHVYSYEPDRLRGAPPGTEIRDAAEVMPRERMTAYAECNSFVLGSNFWRYEMLRQGRGYWVDLDLLLLRPLDLDQDYVFGREREGSINTAVMLAPPDSALVRDLVEFPKAMRRPPWFGARRSFNYYVRRLSQGPLGLEDLPWGTYGPQMLSYFVRKHGLERFAAAPEVFYPVSWHNARLLYEPAEKVDALLTERTYAIHLYNSQLRELAKNPPPKGSFMAAQFDRLGMSSVETRLGSEMASQGSEQYVQPVSAGTMGA